MIEQEDKLGEECLRAQAIIRDAYRYLRDRISTREVIFWAKLEEMIKNG